MADTTKKPTDPKTHPITKLMETTLAKVRELGDAETIIGKPVVTPDGVTVIPVSKVSLGYVSGGTDFASKNHNTKNFAGGGGSGLTILPLGFLVIKPNGDVEFLAADMKATGTVGTIADLIQKSPDIIEKFKRVFAKKPEESGAVTAQ